MREAIGSSWLMVIVLTFVALFSGYLAFSINYSKAFKVKDGIIDRIEKHNGPNSDALDDISEYLQQIGYNSRGSCDRTLDGFEMNYIGVNRNNPPVKNPESGNFNYCIQRIDSFNPAGQMTAAYYRVVVFFSLSLPILDQVASYTISGETININFPEDDYMRQTI